MAHDEATLYYSSRTSDSTYRIPTPPRIVVPPPQLNNNSLPDITLSALNTATFLKTINYKNLITQNALLDWSYERRRDAQLILPYLYMGPMTAAKDEGFLRREGITCLLGARQKGAFEGRLMEGAVRRAREDMGIETHVLDIGSAQDLIQSFPKTTEIIYNHIAASHQATGEVGKVLVFCESGNERSAGLVAAYLMEMHGDVDYIKAMQLVQAQRFCVNFDDGMKRLLQGYWDILCARRDAAGQQQIGGGAANGSGGGMVLDSTSMPPRLKRGLERDEDDAMEGADGDDLERFGGRTFAPFAEEAL